MTHKPIHYSGHAIDRMRERGFTRTDVRTILALGMSFPPVFGRGQVYHEKWMRLAGKGDVGVVYIEDARSIVIVTVERIDWNRKPPEWR